MDNFKETFFKFKKNVEEEFSSINKSFNMMESQLSHTRKSFNNLKSAFDEFASEISDHIIDLDVRVTTIEKRLDNQA